MAILARAPQVLPAPADEFRRLAASLAPEVEVVVLEPGTRLTVSRSGGFVRSG